MIDLLKSCKLCPRNCKVDRLNNKIGFCKATDKLKVARAALHFWEEPCISGEKGSGRGKKGFQRKDSAGSAGGS